MIFDTDWILVKLIHYIHADKIMVHLKIFTSIIVEIIDPKLPKPLLKPLHLIWWFDQSILTGLVIGNTSLAAPE